MQRLHASISSQSLQKRTRSWQTSAACSTHCCRCLRSAFSAPLTTRRIIVELISTTQPSLLPSTLNQATTTELGELSMSMRRPGRDLGTGLRKSRAAPLVVKEVRFWSVAVVCCTFSWWCILVVDRVLDTRNEDPLTHSLAVVERSQQSYT